MQNVHEVARTHESAADVFEMLERELYEDELREINAQLWELPATPERYEAFERAKELMKQRKLGQVVAYLRLFLDRMQNNAKVTTSPAASSTTSPAATPPCQSPAATPPRQSPAATPPRQSPAASSTPSPARRLREFRIEDNE